MVTICYYSSAHITSPPPPPPPPPPPTPTPSPPTPYLVKARHQR